MVQMEQQFMCRKTKTPPKRGSIGQNGLLTLLPARADDLYLPATVLGAAFAGLVVRVRLLLALSLRVYTVGLDALGDEVGLDRFGAAHRELLVVGVATDRVGVADRDDHLEVDAAHLVREVVELRLALGLDHRLVE